MITNYLPQVYSDAPYFEGKCFNGSNIENISSNDFKGKWIILFFYPLDFTFVCPTEICGLNDLQEEFNQLNAEIICCSVDSINNHKEFSLLDRKSGGLFPCNIRLLEDPTKKISKSYGVLMDFGPIKGASNRATFIIDDKRKIRNIDMNNNSVGRNINDILEILKSLQLK